MDLLEVKTHDIKAFAASKAFKGWGFQWTKLCKPPIGNNTTSSPGSYLKEMARQDQIEGSVHLGTFIAAQQVMPPSERIPGTKEGGHDAGNHIDGVCQNLLAP